MTCPGPRRPGILRVSPLVGGRPTVGHMALNHGIGVRIPASQPAFARPSGELRLGRRATHADMPRTSPPSGEGCLAEAAKPRRRTAVSACPNLFEREASAYFLNLIALSSGIPPNSSWHANWRRLRHARHRSAICLHPQKRQRSFTALCWSHRERRRKTRVAQRGAVRLYGPTPTVVDRRVV
jgi:hypothetical protein